MGGFILALLMFFAVPQWGYAEDKPLLEESNHDIIEAYLASELNLDNGSFKNWGENVVFSPRYVFVPKTKVGISNIVKWAAEQDLRIRVSGYRHTFNPVFSDEGQILISLLGLEHVESNAASSFVGGNTGAGEELKTIEFVAGSTDPDKIFCKVGAAVTNDELRDFCLNTSDPFQGCNWTIPVNVILVENTISGTVSSLCHGSGSTNRTLSDLVEEIEFVNVLGELQTINKTSSPELMKAAAGSFGLLGVITSITLKLDRMSFAKTSPKFVKLAKAVPPPPGTLLADMPEQLRDDLDISNQEDLDALIANYSPNFYSRCQDYYAEWFWFILTDKCWVNTWNKDLPENNKANWDHWESGGGELYTGMKKWVNTSMSQFVELFNTEGVKLPRPPFQEAFVKSTNSIITGLLSQHPHILPLPEALHFQHGIRHMRVRDMELEIPVPALENGEPDWSVCQRAWWDAIYVIYKNLEETGKLPINLTLEMRIMGGSDITMASQRNNQYTCAIEVLSTIVVPHHDWKNIVEKIIPLWTSYTNFEGQPLAVRTHWAKEWQGLQFNDLDAESFVKNTHKEAIPEFKQLLSDIASEGGYTLEDIQHRFSNSLWDRVIFQTAE